MGSLLYGLGGIEYAAGSLLGILIGPDLDVDHGNISNTIIRNRAGRWAEIGWNMLWYFYKGSLQHGSALSHFPIVSTMFRLAYIFFFLFIVPYFVMALFVPGAWDVGLEISWWLGLASKHYRIIVGLVCSDVIHWALDVSTTEHAKQKKVSLFGMPLASSRC